MDSQENKNLSRLEIFIRDEINILDIAQSLWKAYLVWNGLIYYFPIAISSLGTFKD